MAERRREHRHRTLRSGKIVFNDRRSIIDCLVRNLSEGGTCLQVNSTVGIPTTFDLMVDGDEARPCRAVWTSDNRIGVEFGLCEAIDVSNQQESGAQSPPTTDISGQVENRGYVRGDLMTLGTALDQVPIGIVLLNQENRAQFINRAYRRMWRLPDTKADSKPPFVALMYHARDTKAYAIPSGDLDAYIAARVDHVKRGDPRPLDLRLTSGEIIRVQCTVLPNGGRMLCYTYVTDIVHHSDELESLQAALDNIEQGIVLLDSMLNAQFMNRAVRELWKVPDELADRKPPFIELVSDAISRRAFDVPAEELEKFIANRLAVVRAGDPTPMDIPHGDGRVIRSHCAVLPGGGRMLTFTDVTDLVHRAAQYEELAALDGLTGLYNRRQFNSLASGEWSRFQRYNRPLSVLLMDIDCFKQINDGHGHDVGDRALAYVAAVCREAQRSTDITARLGGDEFVMLLPETTLGQARIVAERLRERVAERPMPEYQRRHDEIALRVSIGIAEATLSMSSVDALLKLADQALLQAKRIGRNCVVAGGVAVVEHPAAAE
jgi:diguanylate cyclase (GGDEF)-like protein